MSYSDDMPPTVRNVKKVGLKEKAKLFAFRRGILFRRASSIKDIENFIWRFREHFRGFDSHRWRGRWRLPNS